MATYYYCSGGDVETVEASMTVGTEQQYSDGYVGDCRVTKKRKKITVSIASAIPESISIRYQFTHTTTYNYDDPIVQVQYDYITIPAGSLSAYEYVDTYTRTQCNSGSYTNPLE